MSGFAELAVAKTRNPKCARARREALGIAECAAFGLHKNHATGRDK